MAPSKNLEEAQDQTTSPTSSVTSGRPHPPKAWTTGTNPITSRNGASSAVNGGANGHVQHAQDQDRNNVRANKTADKQGADRLLFLFAHFVGLDATITLKGGEQFTGIFSGASTQHGDSRYHMKMVRQLDTTQSNGTLSTSSPFIGEGEDHAMAFDVSDTVDLSVPKVTCRAVNARRSNGALNGTAFRTDVEISGNMNARERVLERWEPEGDDVTMSLGKEESLGSGAWDQFATNERLYNVRSDYNEDIYTTSIDRSNPRYRQLEERASRQAKEIEQGSETRRGPDAGLDEEDRYSGVRRDGPSLVARSANAYVPPSQRTNSNKSPAPGAAIDPAIISSQLARPDTTSRDKSTVDRSTSHDVGPPDTAATSVIATEASTTTAVPQDIKAAVLRSMIPAITNGAPDQTPALRVSTATDVVSPQKTAAENGTDIIRKTTDAFKQFSQAEKLRIQQQQRQQQQQRAKDARNEKSVKLNDLKKFAQNFKLDSRVPEDLVPILAKTKEKQDAIKAKAEQQAREKEDSVPTTPASGVQRGSQTIDAGAESVSASARSRSQQTTKAPIPMRIREIPPYGGVRTQTSSRTGASSATIASPVPIPRQQAPIAPAERVLSPASTASVKFNAKAMEFKPNPAASAYTPTDSSTTSIGTSKRQNVKSPLPAKSKVLPPAVFFESDSKKSKLASEDRDNLTSGHFSSVAWTLSQLDEQKRIKFTANGGMPYGYSTLPVWEHTEANKDKSHIHQFPSAINAPTSPMHTPQHGAMPHQHQLPLHLQNGGSHPQQSPHFYRSQSGMSQQQMDDQRMHFSSSTSSVHPSPRMSQPQMFNGQGYPQMGGHHYMTGANISPQMSFRTGPVPAGYLAGQGPQMGGQMMAQQPSNGPYMVHPGQQMHMYNSPASSHAQPHFGGHPGQGMQYGSSPRGHPMSNQSSQQGHPSQQMFVMPSQGGPMMMMPQHGGPMAPMRSFGQPQFGGQHPAPSPYAMNQRTMSSGGHNHHMTPRQQPAIPQQGTMPPQMHPNTSSNAEDGR